MMGVCQESNVSSVLEAVSRASGLSSQRATHRNATQPARKTAPQKQMERMWRRWGGET